MRGAFASSGSDNQRLGRFHQTVRFTFEPSIFNGTAWQKEKNEKRRQDLQNHPPLAKERRKLASACQGIEPAWYGPALFFCSMHWVWRSCVIQSRGFLIALPSSIKIGGFTFTTFNQWMPSGAGTGASGVTTRYSWPAILPTRFKI
jgi:hypothetical protein